jgi:hypothetical protein
VATATAAKVIEIPEIQLGRLLVTLEGQMPLITHRFGERARKAIEDKQQHAARMAKPPRDPDAEFQDALYPLGEERYGLPAAAVKKALVAAGGRFADETMTVLRGVINVMGDLLEIRAPALRMRSDTVRIDGGRTSSIAYRPAFWPWEIDVTIVFNTTMLSEAQLLNLVQLAGFSIGIGDWRPEKGGTFGTFTLKGAAQA